MTGQAWKLFSYLWDMYVLDSLEESPRINLYLSGYHNPEYNTAHT